MPLRETFPLNAASPYGFTKLSAEALAALYARAEKRPSSSPGRSPIPARGRARISSARTGLVKSPSSKRRRREKERPRTLEGPQGRKYLRPARLQRRAGRRPGLHPAHRERTARRSVQHLFRQSPSPAGDPQDAASGFPGEDRRGGRPGPGPQVRYPASFRKPRQDHPGDGWRPRIPWETTLSDLLNDWRAKMIR